MQHRDMLLLSRKVVPESRIRAKATAFGVSRTSSGFRVFKTSQNRTEAEDSGASRASSGSRVFADINYHVTTRVIEVYVLYPICTGAAASGAIRARGGYRARSSWRQSTSAADLENLHGAVASPRSVMT